jgi:hypothetical protein
MVRVSGLGAGSCEIEIAVTLVDDEAAGSSEDEVESVDFSGRCMEVKGREFPVFGTTESEVESV